MRLEAQESNNDKGEVQVRSTIMFKGMSHDC